VKQKKKKIRRIGKSVIQYSCKHQLKGGAPARHGYRNTKDAVSSALIEYAKMKAVTKAAIKYNVNRQYLYRWLKRNDEAARSLSDISHRPHHHPNEHTEAGLKLISDMRRRNPNAELVVFWVKLRKRAYTRTITGLYRVLRRQGYMAVKSPNPKYIAKPYEKMEYPGQKLHVDVKFVTVTQP